MKTLNLHVDYIKFKALKKAIKSIADLSDSEKEEKYIQDALVVLTAVEKSDSDIKSVVKKLVENVRDIAKQVNVQNIVLYPYAHLSKDLSSPQIAQKVLEEAEKALSKFFVPNQVGLREGVSQGGTRTSSRPSVKGNVNTEGKVIRAPFGYYKEFEMKVKGHPLSELSREIKIEGKETEETYDFKQLLREISKSKLDTSKLKDNDHRILGKQMDLFSFNETAPGMVFWHNNGLIIRNKLIEFMRELMKERDYEEVLTPQIMDKKIWQISGHWDKYKENNFSTEYEGRQFLIKPMNCPGGLLIFKNSPKSYKDLPLKSGEFGIVHRQELSGVLGGLFRVIQFTQDDAHVFCTEKQLGDEIMKLLDLMEIVYSKFSFKYLIELSTRPEKRIGSDKIWDKAEKALKDVLDKRKVKYKINKGDGAFYGPKIDFHLKDSLGRTWQCGTIQVDFSMPERFELEYTDKDNKRKRPIMIHRAIYGSLERFIGILLEHTNGRLPVWLAPIQIRILNFTDRNKKYAEKILENLKKEIPGLRVDMDFSQKTIPAKVKDSEVRKIPYILVVGDREEKEKTLAIRVKGNKKIEMMAVKEFVERIKKEIKERK